MSHIPLKCSRPHFLCLCMPSSEKGRAITSYSIELAHKCDRKDHKMNYTNGKDLYTERRYGIYHLFPPTLNTLIQSSLLLIYENFSIFQLNLL